VPKADGTLRPVSMWAVGDKLVQRVVYDCIEPYFERVFLGCSFGYRPGRGVKQAAQAVFALQQQHRRWVVDLDIQDCFEAFDKKLMLRFVREQVQDHLILRLIRAWLGARVLSDGGSGVSQGAVISPLLANIYLHQLDVALTRQQYQVVRYADDVVICCRTKKEAQHSLAGVTAALARLKLAPNPHKTRIVHVDEGFKFVGHFFLRNEVFRL
jgi:group II intron reverse transcriptase/maturase